MNDSTSIGVILRSERENRGLSLEEVHDATKITAQNLSALEEDRFDSFPNKVYARAFLRDYANFLSLESSHLLTRYEEEWGGNREVAPPPPVRRSSPWKAVGYVFLVVLLLAGLGSAAYFSGFYAKMVKAGSPGRRATVPGRKTDVAALPKVPVVTAKPKPVSTNPAPEMPSKPVPPVPEKLVVEITASRQVWMAVEVDGVKTTYPGFGPGTKSFEAKSKVWVRVGQANAVRVKKNGVPQPLLGTDANPRNATYELPPPPAGAAPPASGPAPAMSPPAGGPTRQ